MRLFISPREGASNDDVRVRGERLFVSGVEYDLSVVPEAPGYAEPAGLPFLGRIYRVDGELFVNLVVHYDAQAARVMDAPGADDLVFTLTDGAMPPVAELISDEGGAE